MNLDMNLRYAIEYHVDDHGLFAPAHEVAMKSRRLLSSDHRSPEVGDSIGQHVGAALERGSFDREEVEVFSLTVVEVEADKDSAIGRMSAL